MIRKFMNARNTLKVVPRLEYLECRTVPALLFQNGNWTTGIANGFGGANTSEIENSFVSYGFTSSTPSFHVADDFTVPSDVLAWTIAKFRVYAYQTGAPAELNTFTKLHLKIYNGDPSAGATVALDCSAANAIDVTATTVFTNVYRVDIDDLQNNERAVKQVSGNLCTTRRFIPGTYWFEWSVEGSASFSAPRANVTVPWEISDNGKNFNVQTGTWGTLADPPSQGGNGKVQDIPFEIVGRFTPLIPPVDGREPISIDYVPQQNAVNESNSSALRARHLVGTENAPAEATPPRERVLSHSSSIEHSIDALFASLVDLGIN